MSGQLNAVNFISNSIITLIFIDMEPRGNPSASTALSDKVCLHFLQVFWSSSAWSWRLNRKSRCTETRRTIPWPCSRSFADSSDGCLVLVDSVFVLIRRLKRRRKFFWFNFWWHSEGFLTSNYATSFVTFFCCQEIVSVSSATAINEWYAHQFPWFEVPTIEEAVAWSLNAFFHANLFFGEHFKGYYLRDLCVKYKLTFGCSHIESTVGRFYTRSLLQ